ncbi:MAG: VacJ family lipoprotein [Alphaproteobacteria bacterium]|nr:VacJ family lipoprotein [Alphaproteobacteria bacterium]OJV12234.1 MAG: hypothetical protein BGO27_05810 [Alphaproteobacteria bacterium 33-17]
MRVAYIMALVLGFSSAANAANLNLLEKDDFDEYGMHFEVIQDPFEKLNRAIYSFNKGLDTVALEPISKVYKKVVPDFAKNRVNDFFVNLSEPVSMINHLLQGNGEGFFQSFSRFLVNSTLGLLGTMDIAGLNGVKKMNTGFADTMANACITSGSYVVLPILGPSSTRDTFGLVLDSVSDPFNYILHKDATLSLKGLQIVHNRDKYAQYLKDIKDLSFDEYTMVKSTYSQKQRKLKNCKPGKNNA